MATNLKTLEKQLENAERRSIYFNLTDERRILKS